MTDVLCVRGSGTQQDADIVDILLSSDAAAIQRGRNHIDDKTRFTRLSLVTRYKYVEKGYVAQVVDNYGKRNGYVRSFRHSVKPNSVETSVEIKVPSGCIK